MTAIVMTVKGRQDLTEACLRSMVKTLDEVISFVLIDAGIGKDRFSLDLLFDLLDPCENIPKGGWHYRNADCNIPQGWNYGLNVVQEAGYDPDVTNVWLLNNDVVFKKSGWLSQLDMKLEESGVGLVGTYGMSVFGWPFVTGGIWGFKLSDALRLREGLQVFDERFAHSLQDVDLCIRFANAGLTVTHVPRMEFGDDPYLVHAISQTELSLHGSMEDLYKLREPERRLFIDKWGRRDGKEGYEGVVEK